MQFLHNFCTLKCLNQLFTSRKEVLPISKDKNEKEITLFIPETLTTTNQFSNFAIATFCSLQSMTVPTLSYKHCITVQQITYHLTENINHLKSRNRMVDYIKCGLNELIENNVISKLDEIQKHYILDCSNLWIDTNFTNYTVLNFSEVKRIFQAENINNFLLLRYFIFLVGTISSKITVYLESGEYKNRVVGNFTIDYLAELSGISERSIIEYNKILEELGLLYVFRQQDFVIDKDNHIKHLSNIYGRPCDIEYIRTFATNQQKYYESYRYVKNNTSKVNNNRRLAQMYQQLLKGGGTDYTNGEVLDIYNYVISENKKYERLYEKKGYEEYLDKIRDTEIFKQFKFINIKED